MADTITIQVNENNSVDEITVEVTETPEVVTVNISQIGEKGDPGVIPPGGWIDQGGWNASANLFPSASVLRGYTWTITVAGELGGYSVEPGAIIRAKIDSPGQTLSDWSIL